jgi:hypothetical protein
MEDRDAPVASRFFRLTPVQAGLLEVRLSENVTWGYTHNCSSWARDTVAAVTGISLNADDPGALWTETPRQLGEAIHQLEKQRQTSPVLPVDAQPAKGSDSVHRETDPPLSDVSLRLMHESEQHVRHIARDHQLAWDHGMDNTVAAVARQARLDGLTGISHMVAGGGVVRFAQADGYTIKEGAIDAHVAANTPLQASIAQLAKEDALRLSEAQEGIALQRNMEMAPFARA